MIVYKNNADNFRSAVDNNTIVKEIEAEYVAKLGRHVAEPERRAWNNSLHFMESVVRKSNMPGDCGILIEYMIPGTSKRIDFIITGHDSSENPNF